MKRDMMKTAASMEGKIPAMYDMSREETRDLIMKAQEGKAFDAIACAFRYGFALGQRYESRHGKDQKQASK